jgi:hypothetical protein
MRRRAGRKRKPGKRKRCGRLEQVRLPSPAEIAKAMPHRRALGERASDQRAESELGRMVLRGELEEVHGLAGEHYRSLYRSYMAAISAPRALAVTAGGFSPCASCPGMGEGKLCLCERRKAEWIDVRIALADSGCTWFVDHVVLYDRPVAQSQHFLVQTGLWAAAQHFGIAKRWAKGVSVRNRG